MAYTITSESYGPRKPFITATATSTDDLAVLGTDFAEGSTCIISTTTYKLDKVKGWIDPSQGGGGGSSSEPLMVTVTETHETIDGDPFDIYTFDKTYTEINAALNAGVPVWVDGAMIISYGSFDGEWHYRTPTIVSDGYDFTSFSADVDHPYPAAFVFGGSN